MHQNTSLFVLLKIKKGGFILQSEKVASFQRGDPFVIAGMVPEQADKMAEKARGRDGDGEEAARRGRRRRRGG